MELGSAPGWWQESGPRVGPDRETAPLLLRSLLKAPGAERQRWSCHLWVAALPRASSSLWGAQSFPAPLGTPVPMAAGPTLLPWSQESRLEQWFAYLGCRWLPPSHLLPRPAPAWGMSSGAVPKCPLTVLSMVQGREGPCGATTPHNAASSPRPPLPSVSGHLDPSSHQRVLMKMGLILLIIGHLNFITGSLVHGIVLRFVVNPRDAISLQYAVANTASVISALLVPRAAG